MLSRPNGAPATPDDLRQCYRLLLGREPDGEGMAYYLDLLPTLTVDDLVRRFLNADEFRRRPLVLETIGGEENAFEVLDVEGFRLHVMAHDQDIANAIRRNRVYEPHVTSVVRERLAPGDTFVDVGANIGWFSVLAGTLLRTGGAVHSIEANVENCVLLQRSIADNGLTERVTVHPVAASDRTATLVLQRQAGTNGLVNDDAQAVAQVGAHPVQALRLDDLLADLDRVDLVKIDIEGSELRAVVGMAELLRGHHPHVLMEFSPDLLRRVSGCEPSELVDVLRSYGYQEARWLRPGEPPAPVNFDTGSLGEAMAATTSDHLDLHLLP